MRIAVAGGTGAAGRRVVEAVRSAGHAAVVLSRSTGVDVTTGAGLDDALVGVSALIDVTNATAVRRTAAEKFFTAATSTLLAAEARAGVGHHVALSIVNCDRVDLGYYFGKRAQERMVLADARGTVLRATQFHEYAGQTLALIKGPLVPLPRMRTQPVSTREVAAALVEAALGEPQGRAADLAGPEPRELIELARLQLEHDGARRWVVPVRVPGRVGRQLREGALVPSADVRRGRDTFEQWLAGQTPSAERTAGA
jgi:uncharacterized protein YbjT (DUF2867 family)